jgi:hypothetical protein
MVEGCAFAFPLNPNELLTISPCRNVTQTHMFEIPVGTSTLSDCPYLQLDRLTRRDGVGGIDARVDSSWSGLTMPLRRGATSRPLDLAAPRGRACPAGSADYFVGLSGEGLSGDPHVQAQYRLRQGRRLR